jgi:chorismate mutase
LLIKILNHVNKRVNKGCNFVAKIKAIKTIDKYNVSEFNVAIERALKTIDDSSTKDLFIVLLNLIEKQNRTINELYTERQQLKDEINKLKGEQGKPDIKGSKKRENISSEQERNNSNYPMFCGNIM